MKPSREWCDAECVEQYIGTPYQCTLFTCGNYGTQYGMTWLPDFCPICGGRMTDEARERFREARRR